MNKAIGFSKRFGSMVISLALPILASAAAEVPGPAKVAGGGAATPGVSITTVQEVLDFVCLVFAWMFYFLIALSVVFVVIGAYKYLTASGEAEKVKSANNTLIYAAIAVAVALFARAVPVLVASFLGSTGGGAGGTIQTC